MDVNSSTHLSRHKLNPEVCELPLTRPIRGRRPRDLTAITDSGELPPYIQSVVVAIRDGVITTHEFAERYHLSLSNASERFRRARQLGWIEALGYYSDGIHYRLNARAGDE